MLFQEYDFEVIVKPGKLNVGLDHLSQIEIGEEPTNLKEWLPDAQIFVVRVMESRFEDIIYFVMIGSALEGYTSQQKRELVVRATYFSIIARNLYKMGSDEILRHYVLTLNEVESLLRLMEELQEDIMQGKW